VKIETIRKQALTHKAKEAGQNDFLWVQCQCWLEINACWWQVRRQYTLGWKQKLRHVPQAHKKKQIQISVGSLPTTKYSTGRSDEGERRKTNVLLKHANGNGAKGKSTEGRKTKINLVHILNLRQPDASKNTMTKELANVVA
jgi:hypothetical protein